MLEAVLFDLGDTLLHVETTSTSAMLERTVRPARARLESLGFKPPPIQQFLRITKRTFFWAYLRSKLARREVQLLPTVWKSYRRMRIDIDMEKTRDVLYVALQELRDCFRVDTDACEVAKVLTEAGYRLGIVSNTWLPGDMIDKHLEMLGLLHFFPVRIYSSEVGYMKPNRRVFEMALDQLGVDADQAMFVGDRADNDVAGAARLGMISVLYARGGRIPRCKVRPTHMVDRLADIPKLASAYSKTT